MKETPSMFRNGRHERVTKVIGCGETMKTESALKEYIREWLLSLAVSFTIGSIAWFVYTQLINYLYLIILEFFDFFTYLIPFVLMLGSVSNAEDIQWTDLGADHLWSTPENWATGGGRPWHR